MGEATLDRNSTKSPRASFGSLPTLTAARRSLADDGCALLTASDFTTNIHLSSHFGNMDI